MMQLFIDDVPVAPRRGTWRECANDAVRLELAVWAGPGKIKWIKTGRILERKPIYRVKAWRRQVDMDKFKAWKMLKHERPKECILLFQTLVNLRYQYA